MERDNGIKKENIAEIIITAVAGLAVIIGYNIYGHHLFKEKEKKELIPANISTEECEIVYKDKKDSTYLCEEKERGKFHGHYNNLNDTCVVDTKDNKKIYCYDTEKDKIKDIKRRKRIKMTCVTTKDNVKIKCIRHF